MHSIINELRIIVVAREKANKETKETIVILKVKIELISES